MPLAFVSNAENRHVETALMILAEQCFATGVFLVNKQHRRNSLRKKTNIESSSKRT
jgi:hypothetical protein